MFQFLDSNHRPLYFNKNYASPFLLRYLPILFCVLSLVTQMGLLSVARHSMVKILMADEVSATPGNSSIFHIKPTLVLTHLLIDSIDSSRKAGNSLNLFLDVL